MDQKQSLEPIFLCNRTDLEKTGAFGAIVQTHHGEKNVLIVCLNHISNQQAKPAHPQDQYRAYENACPHIGIALETFENEFLDRENPDLLVCSTHGARFRVDTGDCISGPCIGDRLTPLALTFTEDAIFLNTAQSTISALK